MKLNNIYTESIAGFEPVTQEWLLREAPHTRVSGVIPSEFGFLHGAFVDFGFEDLGLPSDELRALERAFAGRGVVVPGSGFRLRYASNPGSAVFEPVDGSEVLSLPEDWLSTVTAFSMVTDDYTWVGHRVRSDRSAVFDHSKFSNLPLGWKRN